MISEEDPRPAYVQLAAILRSRIASGEITARLPSERDLHNEFGLAPMTVRKAVRLLREEGLVTIVTGRGAYVVRKDQDQG
jgi:DNA-binding GntR family transcriptional regulator